MPDLVHQDPARRAFRGPGGRAVSRGDLVRRLAIADGDCGDSLQRFGCLSLACLFPDADDLIDSDDFAKRLAGF